MTDKEFWECAFFTVCSMRFHPRNVGPGETLDEDELNEIDLSANVADEMLKMRKERWRQ